MSVIRFPATTPAGKAARELRLIVTDAYVRIAIYSASGNFMSDARLDINTATALADELYQSIPAAAMEAALQEARDKREQTP